VAERKEAEGGGKASGSEGRDIRTREKQLEQCKVEVSSKNDALVRQVA